MPIDYNSGLLAEACYIASPNCNEFPVDTDISLLVIHCISLPEGQFGGNDILDLFVNKLDCSQHVDYADLEGLRVSAHLFIRRDGSVIQCVPFNKRAWHAGVSSFDGQENCNDFSIGIELEGTEYDCYTEPQYSELANVTQQLLKIYPKITRHRIVAHSDIAPERKSDPGECFNWKKYFALLG